MPFASRRRLPASDTLAVSETYSAMGIAAGTNGASRTPSARRKFTDILPETWRRRLCREAWNIGIIPQPAWEIASCGVTQPVQWLQTLPPEMLFADPACLCHADGSRTLFVEAALCREGRGEIWSTHLGAGLDPTTAHFAPLHAEQYHMSYPFPFIDERGSTLFTAETWQANETALYRLVDGAMIREGALFAGRKMIDPTLWRGGDRWWLFCTFRDDGPDSRLHLFHAEQLTGPWTPHPNNPVVVDKGAARPAGPLFMADDKLIRPAQDCSRTYGGAVVLRAIGQLDPNTYREETVRRIDPPPGPYKYGLHTFCPAGDITVIDGKRWTFDLFELLPRIIAKATAGMSR